MSSITIMGRSKQRNNRRLSRTLRQALCLLVTGLVAIVIVLVCAAQRQSSIQLSPPLVRLIWPSLATDAAEQQYEAGMLSQAKRSALTAIRHKPGDVAAIRVLALADEQSGLPRQALQLMAVGTRWSWRDTPTQIWLFRRLRDGGEADAAIIHGEALVARHQDEDEVFASFAKLAADPRNMPALVDAITRGESWRQRFFDYLGNAPPALQPALARLMQTLSHTSARPSEADWRPLLTAMLNSGNGANARSLWLSLFRNDVRPTPILDASFEELPTIGELASGGGLFDWRFDSTAQIYPVQDPSRRNARALYIARAGVGHDPLVQQTLALANGSYDLSFKFRADDPQGQSAIRVSVDCGAGGQQISEPRDLPPWIRGWRTIHLQFAVSPQCASEQLRVDPVGTQAGQSIGAALDDFELISES